MPICRRCVKSLRPAACKLFQQCAAAFIGILISHFKVAGVPWVRNFPFFAGKGQEQMAFSLRITASQAMEVAHVFFIHGDNIVKSIIISPLNLAGFSFATAIFAAPQCASLS